MAGTRPAMTMVRYSSSGKSELMAVGIALNPVRFWRHFHRRGGLSRLSVPTTCRGALPLADGRDKPGHGPNDWFHPVWVGRRPV